MSKRLKVAILYGGASTEHAVSCRSAYWVAKHIDRQRYDVHAVWIDAQHRWWQQDCLDAVMQAPRLCGASEVNQPCVWSVWAQKTDVVLPIMHGPDYEDGHLQGMLDTMQLAIAGPAMTFAALAAHKHLSKCVAQTLGLSVLPSMLLDVKAWQHGAYRLEQIQRSCGFPLFVKPVRAGSSVGIVRVEDAESLAQALAHAFAFDSEVMLEHALWRPRELEVAVLEHPTEPYPRTTAVGEVQLAESTVFYDYHAKYNDVSAATVCVPASIDKALQQCCREGSARLFAAMSGSVMARIDWLYDEPSGKLYFNEVNPIPGLTAISLYPKLWEHAGWQPTQVIDEWIALGLQRYRRKQSLVRDYASLSEAAALKA